MVALLLAPFFRQVASEDATLHLSLSLMGGAKKRKKKVYTKPKKIPHKHKKVKLAVLKFYKVDGQDRVRRWMVVCVHVAYSARGL